MYKSTDVRKAKIDGETYVNVNDLINKIKQHGDKVSGAFSLPEFREVYTLAYCHILELIELIKER